MTVHADVPVAIEIVEKDVIAGDLVMIRRHVFAVNREVRIAVAGGFPFGVFEIAHDLIVSAIFFDDVEDVLDRARLADFIRNDRIAFQRSAIKFIRNERRISADLFGVGNHLFGGRTRDERNGAGKYFGDVIESGAALKLAWTWHLV